jgi:hypothetical protein
VGDEVGGDAAGEAAGIAAAKLAGVRDVVGLGLAFVVDLDPHHDRFGWGEDVEAVGSDVEDFIIHGRAADDVLANELAVEPELADPALEEVDEGEAVLVFAALGPLAPKGFDGVIVGLVAGHHLKRRAGVADDVGDVGFDGGFDQRVIDGLVDRSPLEGLEVGLEIVVDGVVADVLPVGGVQAVGLGALPVPAGAVRNSRHRTGLAAGWLVCKTTADVDHAIHR